jgi:hypothetical protein
MRNVSFIVSDVWSYRNVRYMSWLDNINMYMLLNKILKERTKNCVCQVILFSQTLTATATVTTAGASLHSKRNLSGNGHGFDNTSMIYFNVDILVCTLGSVAYLTRSPFIHKNVTLFLNPWRIRLFIFVSAGISNNWHATLQRHSVHAWLTETLQNVAILNDLYMIFVSIL